VEAEETRVVGDVRVQVGHDVVSFCAEGFLVLVFFFSFVVIVIGGREQRDVQRRPHEP